MLVNLQKFQNMKKKIVIVRYQKKQRKIAMTFEDQTKPVTHDKYDNDKYQKNFRILKLITEAALLCSE